MTRPPKASKTATLLAAVLLGMAESTGLAPRGPLRPKHAVVWLAPPRRDDSGIKLVFPERPPGLSQEADLSVRRRLARAFRWSRAWARVRAGAPWRRSAPE